MVYSGRFQTFDSQRLLRLVAGRVWILITWCPSAQHFSWAQLKRKCNWMMQKGMHLFEKKIHLPISAPTLHINLKNKFNQSRHHTHKQGTFFCHMYSLAYSSPAKNCKQTWHDISHYKIIVHKEEKLLLFHCQVSSIAPSRSKLWYSLAKRTIPNVFDSTACRYGVSKSFGASLPISSMLAAVAS